MPEVYGSLEDTGHNVIFTVSPDNHRIPANLDS